MSSKKNIFVLGFVTLILNSNTRNKIVKPAYREYNRVYEVNEMWTFVGKKHPSNYSRITYAMNRKTNKIIDVAFGLRNKKNLKFRRTMVFNILDTNTSL